MFPLIANAQMAYQTGAVNPTYITSILNAISTWIGMLVPLLIGLAVVVFFFGLVKYIWGGAEAKSAAISSMVWGVIAIAVMVSIWGLVGLLQDISGVGTQTTTNLPEIEGITP
jgi:hypothetical protein